MPPAQSGVQLFWVYVPRAVALVGVHEDHLRFVTFAPLSAQVSSIAPGWITGLAEESSHWSSTEGTGVGAGRLE